MDNKFKTCIAIEKYLREKCPGIAIQVNKKTNSLVITYAKGDSLKTITVMNCFVIYRLKEEIINEIVDFISKATKDSLNCFIKWNYHEKMVEWFLKKSIKKHFSK